MWRHFDASFNFIQDFPEYVGGRGGYREAVAQKDTDGGHAGAELLLPYSATGAKRIEVGHYMDWWIDGRPVYGGQVVAPDSDDFGTIVRGYYDPATGGAGFVDISATATAVARHGTIWAPDIDLSSAEGSDSGDATQAGTAFMTGQKVNGVETPPDAAEDTGEGYRITLNGVAREWAKRQPGHISWLAGRLSDAMVALVGTYGPGALLSTDTSFITNPTAYIASAHDFQKQKTLDIINTYNAYEGYEWGGFIPRPGYSLSEKTAVYCTAPDLTTVHGIVDVRTLAEPMQGSTDMVLDSGTNLTTFRMPRHIMWLEPGINILQTGTGSAPRTLDGADSKYIIHVTTVKIEQPGRVTLTGKKRKYDPAVLLSRLNNRAA
jgi:hypothetical protein